MKLGDLLNPHQYAIEVLDKIEFVRGKLPDGVNDVEEVLNLAIQALEKQIPKKPKKLKYEPLLEDGWKWECPNCGSAVGENKKVPYWTENRDYCDDCGQAIDWSET